MRQNFRVLDSDTHVDPAFDVLMKYADQEFRDREDELKPNLLGEGELRRLTVAPVRYSRVAGSKETEGARIVRGQAHNLAGRTHMRTRLPIAPRVSDDNPTGRLADMDTEGCDIHFLIAGTWAFAAPSLPHDAMIGLYSAYHRYMADYCSADARRLKGHIIAPGNDPEWAARTIREYANADWAAAVWPTLPLDLPIDDPDLDPIWEAAQAANLPIMYHGFTVEPPYYPGYRDVWNNAAMSRAAGQMWGGQRFLAFMVMSGILDRYPDLRIGMTECGHGWLPQWLSRLGHNIDYVRGAVPADLKRTPAEYVADGRVFVGIDFSEGKGMTKAVIDLCGEDVLMYMSDYPHPETVFPDTIDTVISWGDTISESAMRKLLYENAARFYRLTTTPWSDTRAPVGAHA